MTLNPKPSEGLKPGLEAQHSPLSRRRGLSGGRFGLMFLTETVIL